MAELQTQNYICKRALESNGLKVNLVKERLCNIVWIRVKVSIKQDHMEFVIEKHWKMQYYLNLMETEYMEDAQRLKWRLMDLQ